MDQRYYFALVVDSCYAEGFLFLFSTMNCGVCCWLLVVSLFGCDEW